MKLYSRLLCFNLITIDLTTEKKNQANLGLILIHVRDRQGLYRTTLRSLNLLVNKKKIIIKTNPTPFGHINFHYMQTSLYILPHTHTYTHTCTHICVCASVEGICLAVGKRKRSKPIGFVRVHDTLIACHPLIRTRNRGRNTTQNIYISACTYRMPYCIRVN